jgi:hypothetical protein
MVIDFTAAPSLRKIDQVRLLSYYLRASRAMRALLRSGTLKDIYLANIDNLLSNHVLQLVKTNRIHPKPRLSVVAEGFMNYQNISKGNRAAWRWAIKPLAAAFLGLKYKHPAGHLSGSEEDAIERVFAYSSIGLKSPPQKFVAAAFPSVKTIVEPDANAALLIMTGIGQWMTPEKFDVFKAAFVDWMNAQRFEKVFVKRHPFYPSGGIEDLIANAVVIEDSRRLEQMAGELPAQNVIGYCTTGLVILKLMRPDLTFTDWGSNFYCEHAYHGDRSVIDVLRSASIDIVEMRETPAHGASDAFPDLSPRKEHQPAQQIGEAH